MFNFQKREQQSLYKQQYRVKKKAGGMQLYFISLLTVDFQADR